MQAERFLHTIDGISTWVGKAAAWLIILLMSAVCIEVFKRYIMNMPTAWIFDLTNMLYGSLFMLCGAYTLAQNAHVRGDFLYSSMKPRTQATLDLILYIMFFVPGIAALIYAGADYAADSWRINEHSNVTADGPPVYHFKTVIPIAGTLLPLADTVLFADGEQLALVGFLAGYRGLTRQAYLTGREPDVDRDEGPGEGHRLADRDRIGIRGRGRKTGDGRERGDKSSEPLHRVLPRKSFWRL